MRRNEKRIEHLKITNKCIRAARKKIIDKNALFMTIEIPLDYVMEVKGRIIDANKLRHLLK